MYLGRAPGDAQMPFSKQPELVPWHCYKTNHWLAPWDGFPDPGLPLVLLGRALITNALLVLQNHPEEMKKKRKDGEKLSFKVRK